MSTGINKKHTLAINERHSAKHQKIEERISKDILIEIFLYLDVQELLRASQVCKQWNTLIRESESIWKRFCILQKYPFIPETWGEVALKIAQFQRVVKTPVKQTRAFFVKEALQPPLQIQSPISGSSARVFGFLQMHEEMDERNGNDVRNHIANTFSLYDENTGEIVRTFEGAPATISEFKYSADSETIVANCKPYSYKEAQETSLTVWSFHQTQPLFSVCPQNLYSFFLSPDYLILISHEGKITGYSLKTGKPEIACETGFKEISASNVVGNYCLFSSREGLFALWSLNSLTRECEIKHSSFKNVLSFSYANNRYIISHLSDDKIYIWDCDLSTPQLVYQTEGRGYFLFGEKLIILPPLDGNQISLFDLSNFHCFTIETTFGFNDLFVFQAPFLFIGSTDGITIVQLCQKSATELEMNEKNTLKLLKVEDSSARVTNILQTQQYGLPSFLMIASTHIVMGFHPDQVYRWDHFLAGLLQKPNVPSLSQN